VINIKWPNYFFQLHQLPRVDLNSITAVRMHSGHGSKVVLCGVLFCAPYQWIKPRQKINTKGQTSGYENYRNIGKIPQAQSATVDKSYCKTYKEMTIPVLTTLQLKRYHTTHQLASVGSLQEA
jgi:hypothetical protein